MPRGATRVSRCALALWLAGAALAPAGAVPAGPVAGPPLVLAQGAPSAERGWDRATRRVVQEALVWTGDYDSGIDGAIGPRTRAAIRDFQRRRGDPATGELTQGQIRSLMVARRAALEDTGFRIVDDPETGIRIGIPTALVARSHRDGPTVVYKPRREGATITSLALISMPGGRAELDELFRVLTHPEVVEPDAYTVLKDTFLVVSDEKDGTVTYTYVRAVGGALKGFALAWSERLRDTYDPLAVMMYNTFEPIPGVLD